MKVSYFVFWVYYYWFPGDIISGQPQAMFKIWVFLRLSKAYKKKKKAQKPVKACGLIQFTLTQNVYLWVSDGRGMLFTSFSS